MSAVETRPDVDLEALVVEPLPPCESRMRRAASLVGLRAAPVPPPCGQPPVTVVTYTCMAACRPPWRRAICVEHLVLTLRARPEQHRCGYCTAPLATAVSS